MQDAMSDALDTIERQINKALNTSTGSTTIEDIELAHAGMTLFAFVLGRIDTIAVSLERIATVAEARRGGDGLG